MFSQATWKNSEWQRHFLLTLAIAVRGDVSQHTRCNATGLLEGPTCAHFIRELARARLITPDGRNVRFTDIGRRHVQAWLEQRLEDSGTLRRSGRSNFVSNGLCSGTPKV